MKNFTLSDFGIDFVHADLMCGVYSPSWQRSEGSHQLTYSHETTAVPKAPHA